MAGNEGTDRTVVVPEAFIYALGTRLLRDFGPNAAERILYDIGRDAGRAFARMTERYLGPIREREDVEAMIRTFDTEYHWADIRLREFDFAGKSAVVEWRNGVGVPRGGSPEPVCHLGRGLLSGAAEIVFGAKCDAIETKCQAMGAESCEIVVGVPERMAEVAERGR